MKYIILLLTIGYGLWATPANAGRYLSDYSYGGSSARSGHYLSGYSNNGGSYSGLHIGGGRGGYISRVGAGNSFGCCSIDAPHRGEHQRRLQRAKEIEAARQEWFNANPPCGIYGRVPARCKRGR